MNTTLTAPRCHPGSASRPPFVEAEMHIEPITYREWPAAYRCTVQDIELTVVASMGPRIMALQFKGGANILHEDAVHFRVGEWHFRGGHRFTTAPESAASYLPDNAPCRVREELGGLRITQPVDARGLEKSLLIRAAPRGEGFEVVHHLRNPGGVPWHGAPWAITSTVAAGSVVVPWGGGSDQWRTQMVRYLVHAGSPYANATSPQWRPAADHFVIEPAGQRGKVGLYSDQGWLALLRTDGTFVKHLPVIAPESACPDGGCNVEVFIGADYIELETLGPLTTLGPGQELVHVERWYLLRETFRPSQWSTLAARLAYE